MRARRAAGLIVRRGAGALQRLLGARRAAERLPPLEWRARPRRGRQHLRRRRPRVRRCAAREPAARRLRRERPQRDGSLQLGRRGHAAARDEWIRDAAAMGARGLREAAERRRRKMHRVRLGPAQRAREARGGRARGGLPPRGDALRGQPVPPAPRRGRDVLQGEPSPTVAHVYPSERGGVSESHWPGPWF